MNLEVSKMSTISRSAVVVVIAVAVGMLACNRVDHRAARAGLDVPEYVGQEEALRGLTRIRVNPGFLNVREQTLALSDDLLKRVEKRMLEAGLELVSAEEAELNPGITMMEIYPSSSGNDSAGLGDRKSCCTANVWISVLEGTSLDRAPEIHRRLPIWGAGSNESCANGAVSAGDIILQVVDQFIADVRVANAPKPEGSDGDSGGSSS